MKQQQSNSYLFGGNAPYVEDLYESYLNNPGSVSDTWREYFDNLQIVPASDGNAQTRDVAHAPIVQSFSEASLKVCEKCAGELRKVYGNVGISFKGSGFYKNDARTGSSNGSSGSAGSGSSSSGTADSGSSTSSGTASSSDSSGSGSGSGSSGSGGGSSDSSSSSGSSGSSGSSHGAAAAAPATK